MHTLRLSSRPRAAVRPHLTPLPLSYPSVARRDGGYGANQTHQRNRTTKYSTYTKCRGSPMHAWRLYWSPAALGPGMEQPTSMLKKSVTRVFSRSPPTLDTQQAGAREPTEPSLERSPFADCRPHTPRADGSFSSPSRGGRSPTHAAHWSSLRKLHR